MAGIDQGFSMISYTSHCPLTPCTAQSLIHPLNVSQSPRVQTDSDCLFAFIFNNNSPGLRGLIMLYAAVANHDLEDSQQREGSTHVQRAEDWADSFFIKRMFLILTVLLLQKQRLSADTDASLAELQLCLK